MFVVLQVADQPAATGRRDGPASPAAGATLVPVSVLRQGGALQGEPQAARAQAHRRAAVRLSLLRPRVRRQERPDATLAHPHRRAALSLRDVRQMLCARRLSIQTPHHPHSQLARASPSSTLTAVNNQQLTVT
ncbi:hypothetical protein LSTR_LSTR017569 [Laodelphax striatellus]|uniref:Uncharacterized protein n=1 Tax=Laodelphax striatellus TaxID=195883 RepID=A0A482XIC5_LAOST|nr:hypothetical protein LSTR_LSTR017569 [Laodelphax striatellus]